MTDRPPLLKLTGAEFPRLEDTVRRPLSDECRLGYPEACTDVANPHQAPRDRVACHGPAHVATF